VGKVIYHRIWESEEINIIFQALDVIIGTPEDFKVVNLEKICYHKVMITTDDAHISSR
jgi:DNA gyrase subunit B